MWSRQRKWGGELLRHRRRGNVLIVRPAGETLGFSPTFLQQEKKELLAEIQQPGLQSLIVDLSAHSYLGTQTLAAMTEAGDAARALGLNTILCGASSEQQLTLESLGLERDWLVIDSPRAACRKFMKITLEGRVIEWRPWLIGFACVLLLFGTAAAYQSYRNAQVAERASETYDRIWSEYRELYGPRRIPSVKRWFDFKQEAEQDLQNTAERLRTWNEGDPRVRDRLVSIGQDVLRPAISSHAKPSDEEIASVERSLRVAQQLAQGDSDAVAAAETAPARPSFGH